MKRKIFKPFSEDGGFYISLLIFGAFSVLSGLIGGFQLALIGLSFLAFAVIMVVLLRMVYATRDRAQKAGQAVMSNVTLDFIMHFEMPVVIISTGGDIIWYNKSFSKAAQNTSPLYSFSVQEFLAEKLSMERVKRVAERTITRDGEEERPILVTMRGVQYRLHLNLMQSAGTRYYITVWQDMSQVIELARELTARNPLFAYVAVDNAAEATGFLQTEYRTISAKIAILLKEWSDSLQGVLQEVEKEKYLFVFEEGKLEQLTTQKFEILDKVRDISMSTGSSTPITVSLGVAASGELVNLIKKSGNVIIMGHKYADHDSVGACIGMARLAMQYCNKVNIVVNINDNNLKNIFRKLRGISIYRDVFVDGATAQDLIEPDTLLVAVDVNNPAHFEAPEIYKNASKMVVIDHHRKTIEYDVQPSITYIEPSASSASELMCEILEQALEPGQLLKEEAEVLFSGILLDTKQFTRNTGVRTFAAALFLRGEGANPNEAQMLFKIELSEFVREAMFENNVVVYRNIIAISVFKGEALAGDKIAASKVAERLLGVEGVLASFALCEIDGTVHISARSSGTINVQLVVEKLGGGGHFDMAGAQLPNTSMQQALVQLKKVIDEYLSEE